MISTANANPVTTQQVMELSAHGWRVHPLHSVDALGVCSCPDGKSCKSAGKHPRIKAWQKAATTEEDVISDWWERWPKSNVAVVMGPSSGIIDLDCDSEEGEKFILELFEGCEEALETPTFRSSRGRHRLYKYTSGLPNSDKGHWKLPGIDVDFKIGNGGLGTYCVFPPSLHSSGAHYQWEKHPDDYSVLDLPSIVIDRLHVISTEGGLSVPKGQAKPKEHFERILNGVSEGERNESAASLCGKLISDMENPADEGQQEFALAMLRNWNLRNSPPLSEKELCQTFYSILSRELSKNELQPSSDDPAKKKLDYLRRYLGLPRLKRIVRRGEDHAIYEFHLDDGMVLPIGSVKAILSVSTVREIILDKTGHQIKMDKRAWGEKKIAQLIRELSEQEDIGDQNLYDEFIAEFFEEKTVKLWGKELEAEPGGDEWWYYVLEKIKKSDGFSGGAFTDPVTGFMYLHFPSFANYVKRFRGEKHTNDEIRKGLSRANFKAPKRAVGKQFNGSRAQVMLWHRTKNVKQVKVV